MMLLLLHQKIALCSMIASAALLVSGAEDETTFDSGFGDWVVENGTWIISSWKEISKNYSSPALPDPPSFDNKTAKTSSNMPSSSSEKIAFVAVPSISLANNSVPNTAAIMHLDLNSSGNTDLEVLFTCLVFGWNESNNILNWRSNPSLQVMYDDVLVFNIENAIKNASSDYSINEWNQFRLFSSYKTNISMRITILASRGTDARNLVAVDTIIVKMDNATTSSSISLAEPEADIEDEAGAWNRIETGSEEEENLEEKSILSSKPEFCDLMPEIGACKGNWPRFYYNASIDDCTQFDYSGCDGNENNFHSLLACRAICKKPNQSEEDLIFQLIFGSLGANVVKKEFTELFLDFESSNFEDWHVDNWSILRLDSDEARFGRIIPSTFNGLSKVAAMPDRHLTIAGRPRLSHPIRLIPNSNITFQFSLLVTGNVNPTLMPFFETLNPGFKIYIGDFLLFDYFLDAHRGGRFDTGWHEFSVSESTDKILNLPGLTNNGSQIQMVQIEAWKGGDESSLIVLDDLHIFQSSANQPGKNDNSSLSFPCYMAMSVGPCTQSLQRYYYDSKEASCKPFVFGGCRGNANNFLTFQDCNDKCSPTVANSPTQRCTLPKEEGTCSDYTERFYFDAQQAKCMAFIFKGCSSDAGTANNFLTMAECESECRSFINGSLSSVTAFPRMTSDCHRKIDMGSCSSPIQMWAFDEDRGRCVPFTYGGCGGNQNRFFTRAVCAQTCESLATTTPEATTSPQKYIVKTKSACSKPRIGSSVTCGKGVNLSKFYYYDRDTNTCETEIGCPVPINDTSIGNRFFNKATCIKLCQLKNSSSKAPELKNFESCFLPTDGGGESCKNESLLRYYFDLESSNCETFRYSGCGGNNNNFESFSECRLTCHGIPEKYTDLRSKCAMPRDPGVGSKVALKVYHDESGECVPFKYFGSKGNLNRFNSVEECAQFCIAQTSYFVTEVVVGVVLAILLIIGSYVAWKYYWIYKSKENYRIFQNQQIQRQDSISPTLQPQVHSSAGAYENPAFEGGGGGNSFQMHENL